MAELVERDALLNQVFQAENMPAIKQLVAGMAHEINNPLFVISGRLEMLLEEDMPEKIRADLNIVKAQAQRIRNLVDRLLKFSRKAAPKFEALNINQAIEGALPLLAQYELPDRKIEIEKDFAAKLPLVKGDLNQLQEVFINLLINAYQAMPQGGKLSIKTVKPAGQYVEIRIKDTGSGITAENLKKIFMPFFSTKKEGAGLGLAICYNIIKDHGGFIDIESRVDCGTAFIIKLPCS